MKKFSAAVIILMLVAVLTTSCATAPPATPIPAPTPSPTPTPTPTLTPTPPATLPTGTGMLEIRVTDPPPPDMDHIWVKLQSLEIHKAGGSWITIDDVEETEPFDLKAIEGLEAYLASQVVEVGRYTQIRLGVEPGAVTIDIDEDIEGDEYDAKVPSEKIKLVGTFEVVENETTVITLDFDGMKSVHVTGAGNYMFKPVIKLIVERPSPPSSAPTMTSVDPDSGNQGQTLDVTITGTNLTGGTVDSFGADITINSSTVDSDTQITANITIDPGATLGTRDVTVTTPEGTSTLTDGFTVTVTVTAPAAPTVTSVDPNSGNQGQTLDVTITGTNLTGGTVDFGDGITINSSTVVSDTQITADITIDPVATLGTRDVTVTTPGGTDTLTDGFEVTTE